MYTASEAVSAVYRAWGCIEVASCFVAIVTSGIKITAAMPGFYSHSHPSFL